jgi:hypothetical protein
VRPAPTVCARRSKRRRSAGCRSHRQEQAGEPGRFLDPPGLHPIASGALVSPKESGKSQRFRGFRQA